VAVYFCSDPHAFHGNIMKFCRRVQFMTDSDRESFLELESQGADLRPFRVSLESIDNMNRGLAANINARVGPRDVLWCLGDWAWGRGPEYKRNARWFRDQILCQTIHFVWGNHDDRSIRDLFQDVYDQVQVSVDGVRITLNHFPMVTWNGQHHASLAEPNIHLYGHVHAIYDKEPDASPLKDSDAWPALDVGFDGHEYRVWSLAEVLDRLRPKLEAFEMLKRCRKQFDPFRGRGHRGATV
jgi:calcineurin-like phosphoesterase family protein